MNSLLMISTANCFLELLAPMVIKFITEFIYAEDKFDRTLRGDLQNMKQEVARVSMVDEFSKYAKLQRKYNKLEAELKGKVNTRLTSRMKTRLLISYGFSILNTIAILVLLYLYRLEPVIVLPKDALWPIHNYVSWPCPLENSISLTVWLVIARLVVSICK